jgi:hypothetical protein
VSGFSAFEATVLKLKKPSKTKEHFGSPLYMYLKSAICIADVENIDQTSDFYPNMTMKII